MTYRVLCDLHRRMFHDDRDHREYEPFPEFSDALDRDWILDLVALMDDDNEREAEAARSIFR